MAIGNVVFNSIKEFKNEPKVIRFILFIVNRFVVQRHLLSNLESPIAVRKASGFQYSR